VLAAHVREKKKKYLEPCLKQRRHFSPFVVSTDGLFGKEAKIVLKSLALMLTEKWGKPYSEVCGYVNAGMSIAIVRATHLCVRGWCIPTSKMSKRLPQWEDQADCHSFYLPISPHIFTTSRENFLRQLSHSRENQQRDSPQFCPQA
jgi:hypothetical protein